MDIIRFGNAASFRALKPGECFAFDQDDSGKVGLKIAGDSCVMLGREPPSLLPFKLVSDPVFRFAEAKFLPSHDPAQIQSGSRSLDAGNGLLCGEQLLLIVDTGAGTIFVDVATGEIVAKPAADPIVTFTAWRIVQKWLDDEHHTICVYETRGQKKLGFHRS